MFSSKRIRGLVGMSFALCTGYASAFVVTAGNIKFTIDNYDSGTTGYGNTAGVKCTSAAQCDTVAGITPAPGAHGTGIDTMGIFSVAAITNTTNNTPIFTRGVDGFLTGIFTGLRDNEISVNACASSMCTTAKSVGGTFNLWQNATDYNPNLGPNGAGVDLPLGIYSGISSGLLYLSGVFAAGVVAGDTTTTYQSIFDNFSFAGNSSGFLDVTGGSALNTFNTNSLTDANGNQHDLFATITFDDIGGVASSKGFTVQSSGQITGAAVPEPGTLALVALALLGAGYAGRRQQPQVPQN